jgi:hypothetical protein
MSDARVVWFHEDDYCQIELLPKSAEDFARRQAGEINQFAEEHKAGDVGWTDMYTRSEPPASLATIGITLETLATQIPSRLTRYERVTTGYSTHTVPAPRTIAWGTTGRGVIYANYDRANVIQNVWFGWFTRGDVEVMREFLKKCADRWPMILADWAWSEIVDLANESDVVAYLNLRTAPNPS